MNDVGSFDLVVILEVIFVGEDVVDLMVLFPFEEALGLVMVDLFVGVIVAVILQKKNKQLPFDTSQKVVPIALIFFLQSCIL